MTLTKPSKRYVNSEDASESLRPPGPDARDDIPDVEREALQTITDQINGERPSTVLGVLVDRRKALPIVAIAGLIDKPLPEVEWTIEVLGERELCEVYDDDGIQMVQLSQPDKG